MFGSRLAFLKFSLDLRAMPRLAKPSDQPQAQRERVCKTRYGENAAGRWVRRSAFREIDYAPDDPTKLRECATFENFHGIDQSKMIFIGQKVIQILFFIRLLILKSK